jgi:hypothetical protein
LQQSDYGDRPSCREEGTMVSIRQLLLVIHHRDDSWLRRPSAHSKGIKVYAIVIGFLGLILTGILIAVAVYAATVAFAENGFKGKAN